MHIAGDHDIHFHRQVVKQSDILKCSGDPKRSRLIRANTGDVLPLIQDLARISRINPRDRVEDCRLACSVRTNEPVNTAGHDRQIKFVDRMDTAEALIHLYHFKYRSLCVLVRSVFQGQVHSLLISRFCLPRFLIHRIIPLTENSR